MHDIRDFSYDMLCYLEKIPYRLRAEILKSDVKINNLSELQNVTEAIIKAHDNAKD